jgi:hypothetical protein
MRKDKRWIDQLASNVEAAPSSGDVKVVYNVTKSTVQRKPKTSRSC